MDSIDLLGFEFNDDQKIVLDILSSFIENNYMCPKIIFNRNNKQLLTDDQLELLSDYPRFLLTGSAGTGKTSLIVYLIISSWFNILPINTSPKYILAAPTNKAKEVLMNKFKNIINVFDISFASNEKYQKFNISKKIETLIEFKTVSQVLGINSHINKRGEQEFTKGNIKKIKKKFLKNDYNNLILIIDECSMIDENFFKLLQQIQKPIIYLGDPCQLPPVNEDYSELFKLIDIDDELIFYNLTEVMRSKDLITSCCNYMRNIILGLENKISDICFQDLYDKYVLGNEKNKNIKYFNNRPNKWFSKYIKRCLDKEKVNNDIGICYTNKRCKELNNRIRIKLYTEQFLNNNVPSTQNNNQNNKNLIIPYLMKNEKIIVKLPYYAYGSNFYNSLILRINNFEEVIYTPPNLLEWIATCMNIINNLNTNNTTLNENIDNLIKQELDKEREIEKQKGTLFQFGFNEKKKINLESHESIIKKKKDEFKKLIRNTFHACHSYKENVKKCYDYKTKKTIIPETIKDNDTFIKINNIINPIEQKPLNDSDKDNNSSTIDEYKSIHQNITKFGYGIPIENICCNTCIFFAPFINKLITNNDNIAINFIKLIKNIKFKCYMCDLTSSNNERNKAPLIHEDDLEKYEDLKLNVKSLLSSCYNKKLILTDNESKNLKKHLDTDDYNILKSTLGIYGRFITSIPYSLIFGHYWNHIFVEPILHWDYGYFITTHKSQGSDYDEVFVDGNNLLKNSKKLEKNKLIYTGLSRAKNRLNIYT
jgi:hypothetical protein